MPKIYKKILLGTACLTGFVIVVLSIIYLMNSGMTVAIYQQLSALRAGHIDKAYEMTSRDFRAATSLSDFEEFVNHYTPLKNNKSVTLSDRDRQDEAGSVKATLYSTDGVAIQVEYMLVKEEGSWKILGIQVNPTGFAEENEDASDAPVTLNTYDNKDSRYSMQYPSNWQYERAGDGTVVFSGKRGTDSFFSTVNIQTVLSKKNGGDFSSVKQFMIDIKHQALTQSPGVKFLENGPFTIKEKNGTQDEGEYLIFTYKYKGKEFKQWQIVVLRNDGQVFYAWAYTSPVAQYANDLATAKAMLTSWMIY